MVEISLKYNDNTICEYFSGAVPRVGEFVNISCNGTEGMFIVTKVTHRVFEKKRKYDEKIHSYCIVEVENIEE